jgi:hypothetical protein
MAGQDQRAKHAVLTCWKDIAQYLGKGVRTVQRWERELALPVRRPNNCASKGPVTACTADLDNWLTTHWSERSPATSYRKALPVPVHTSQENPLVATARQLRNQNHLLVEELLKSIEDLRLTCSVFETNRLQNGKPRAKSASEAA